MGENIYGYCPTCGEPGELRERRPNGNDTCEAGHTYPSAEATHGQWGWIIQLNGCGNWMYCGQEIDELLSCLRAELEAGDAGEFEYLVSQRYFSQKELDEMPEFPGW